jgi:hypothetical protein
MAQPPEVTIPAIFAEEEQAAVAGRSTVRTSALDASLANIQDFSDAVRENIGIIQRDDGEIRDAMVKMHTLAADVLALISSGAFVWRGAWVTTTDYAMGDLIAQDDSIYISAVAHASGTFATDLAADKWVQFFTSSNASNTSFTSTTNISASNVQAAIEELDAETRASNNLFFYQNCGGL